MIVVADSGPLHYLILLGHVGLLQRFYGGVAVPEAVAAELVARGAPDAVRAWIRRPASGGQVLGHPAGRCTQFSAMTRNLHAN